MTTVQNVAGRKALCEITKGRRVLAWVNVGGSMIMVEISPSKLSKSLYEGDNHEFLNCEVRDLGAFVEIKQA